MIEVRNVTKRYGSVKALDDVSFTADSGEVLGLLGPNGAGKSTTMNIMTGYLSAGEGTVLIDGVDILACGELHAGDDEQPYFPADSHCSLAV